MVLSVVFMMIGNGYDMMLNKMFANREIRAKCTAFVFIHHVDLFLLCVCAWPMR